jgi:gamma-glutamyltranspeptidase/glutathione hydrolase
MVAADHRLASQAGAEVLGRGGNAVDAAVATALACGMVQPASSGLGGGGFAVVVLPDGDAHVVDFREVAPAAAHRDMYVESTLPDASRVGGLAVGVPGEPRGLLELHRRWGVLSLEDVARPAVALGRQGFEIGPHLLEVIEAAGDDGERIRCALLDDCGREDVVRRTALSRTIRRYARTDGEWLMTGEGAEEIVASAREEGGLLTLEDLADYEVAIREPLRGTYRGWTVITMPPPSSGGLVILQVLSVLEKTDLSALGHNSSDLIHLYAETFQHGFADRAEFMGDPDRIDIPIESLLSVDRIDAIAADYDASRTRDLEHYGTRVHAGTDGGTQHISVIDEEGMAVALTTTINTGFGSRVITPGGLVLNNEMDDFVARPGEPNYFGLIGSEANAVAPGSRPLSSMSPTVLISPDGRERIVVGASGGPFIITSTLQTIINIIDFGLDASEAVSRPRVHHQWVPEILFLDEGIPLDTLRALEARGHQVAYKDFYSSVQVIRTVDGDPEGASDPRKGGWPAGEGG